MIVANIKVDVTDRGYRLTFDASFYDSFANNRYDQLEAEGETLAEALASLHEQVELIG